MAERLTLNVQQLQALLDAVPEERVAAQGETETQTVPPQITFDRFRNPFPVGFYISREEWFNVNARASIAGLTITINGLFLTPLGRLVPFSHTLKPAGDRSESALQFTMGEGFLLSARFLVSPAPVRRGQCYATLIVFEGFPTTGTAIRYLFGGYLETDHSPRYPESFPDPHTAGHGILRSILGTAPAAGTEISETVPTTARWVFHSLRATLTTSATVADRYVSLRFTDTVNTFERIQFATLQAASLAITYFFGAGITVQALPTSLGITSIPIQPVPLLQTWLIQTASANLQAGDQWSAPTYLVEEWLEV